jgi:hypothetical protein
MNKKKPVNKCQGCDFDIDKDNILDIARIAMRTTAKMASEATGLTCAAYITDPILSKEEMDEVVVKALNDAVEDKFEELEEEKLVKELIQANIEAQAMRDRANVADIAYVVIMADRW